jgi:Family of unknown function (DUF5670)
MYGGAQSVHKAKGRIALCTATPPKKGVAPQSLAQTLKGTVRALSWPGNSEFNHERRVNMLYTIAVALIILWLLGLVTSYTMGGLIHVLLVIAIVVVLLKVISGRSPL